ncbi:hypothetical protein D3C78_891810 [compost metagenome]
MSFFTFCDKHGLWMNIIMNNLSINIKLYVKQVFQINFLNFAANDIFSTVEAVQIYLSNFLAFNSECNRLSIRNLNKLGVFSSHTCIPTKWEQAKRKLRLVSFKREQLGPKSNGELSNQNPCTFCKEIMSPFMHRHDDKEHENRQKNDLQQFQS